MIGDDVICPYKGKCKSYPHRCSTCRHNRGKKDYYEPDRIDPWRPYPSIPWRANVSTKIIKEELWLG